MVCLPGVTYDGHKNAIRIAASLASTGAATCVAGGTVPHRHPAGALDATTATAVPAARPGAVAGAGHDCAAGFCRARPHPGRDRVRHHHLPTPGSQLPTAPHHPTDPRPHPGRAVPCFQLPTTNPHPLTPFPLHPLISSDRQLSTTTHHPTGRRARACPTSCYGRAARNPIPGPQLPTTTRHPLTHSPAHPRTPPGPKLPTTTPHPLTHSPTHPRIPSACPGRSRPARDYAPA